MADNVLVVEADHQIPDGWRQANVEDAEALREDILAQMGEWYIAQVEGGWVNGLGYGGNVVAEGYKELGHMVIIRCTEQIQGDLVRICFAAILCFRVKSRRQDTKKSTHSKNYFLPLIIMIGLDFDGLVNF